MIGSRKFQCYDCNHVWSEPHGTGRPMSCPACGSRNMHRAEGDRGPRRACVPRRTSGGPPGAGRGRCRTRDALGRWA